MRGIRAALTAVLTVMAVCGVAEAFDEGMSRLGVSFGGVHIMGLYYEYHFDEDAAVRAQVGYMLNAVSLNVSGVWYADRDDYRPYAGLGVQKHLVGNHFEGANLICVPLGVDADLDNGAYIAAELIPAISFPPHQKRPDERAGLFGYILPLPQFSLKYELK